MSKSRHHGEKIPEGSSHSSDRDAAAPPDRSVMTTVLKSRTGPGVHSWGFGGDSVTTKCILRGDSSKSMSLCTFQVHGYLPLCTSISSIK